jgi:hypothetical protein
MFSAKPELILVVCPYLLQWYTINYSTKFTLNYSTLGDSDLRISRAPHLHEMSESYVATLGSLPMKGRKVMVGHNFRNQRHIYLSTVSDTGGFLARFSKGRLSVAGCLPNLSSALTNRSPQPRRPQTRSSRTRSSALWTNWNRCFAWVLWLSFDQFNEAFLVLICHHDFHFPHLPHHIPHCSILPPPYDDLVFNLLHTYATTICMCPLWLPH